MSFMVLCLGLRLFVGYCNTEILFCGSFILICIWVVLVGFWYLYLVLIY